MLDDVSFKVVFFMLSWAMLWHLGARMSQHEPRRANPRGFGGVGWSQGREVPPRSRRLGCSWPRGGRAVRPKDLGSKDQKIQKVKLKGSKDERSKDSYKDSRYQGLKESSLTLQGTHYESPTALLPQGPADNYRS